MAIQGLRDTSGFTVAGQRPENWREGALLLFPNGMAPLTALTSVMRSESSDDPKFHWFEKVMSDQRIRMNEDLDATETEITVVSGALEVRIGHILLVEFTGELLRVTADNPTDTSIATVVRGYGGTSAGTVTIATQNPWLLVVGTAFEEGSSVPKGVSYDPTEQFNYTQIFRNTLEMTETARRTRLRTGDQVREAKRECLQYHTIEMERAFWFSVRASLTANGRPLKLTEGFFPFMTRRAASRVVTAPATSGLDDLEGWMKDIFDYGSSEKVAFLGNRAAMIINRIVRLGSSVAYQLNQGQKEFGMNVTRLVSPFGELVLKTHPLFNRIYSNLAPAAAPNYTAVDSWMAVIDMEEIRYRYLDGRDTKFDGDQAAPGDDSMKSGYLSESGIEWRFPETHFVVKGLIGAEVG